MCRILVLLEQRVIERQYGAAGIAENNLNPLINQCFDDDFRTGDGFCRHDLILKVLYPHWAHKNTQSQRAFRAAVADLSG